jgi:hypothetical protein
VPRECDWRKPDREFKAGVVAELDGCHTTLAMACRQYTGLRLSGVAARRVHPRDSRPLSALPDIGGDRDDKVGDGRGGGPATRANGRPADPAPYGRSVRPTRSCPRSGPGESRGWTQLIGSFRARRSLDASTFQRSALFFVDDTIRTACLRASCTLDSGRTSPAFLPHPAGRWLLPTRSAALLMSRLTIDNRGESEACRLLAIQW